MSKKPKSLLMKRIIDVCMTISLLFLMAFQVTGEVLHEWTGIAMSLLVLVHQILNRKWYGAFFKGKYNLYRIMTTGVNILLLLSFVLTALSGMAMSGHAVPFLYGMIKVYYSRIIHISMSHWTFVLMGMHLGLHIPVIATKWNKTGRRMIVLTSVFCIIAGIGFFLFLRSGMPDYMFLNAVFASFDYNKSVVLVFFENVTILLFWVFIGTQLYSLCRKGSGNNNRNNLQLPIVFIIASVAIGAILYMVKT